MKFSSRRYVTLVMILGVLIATFCLPIGVAHARVQNISITKLIDQPNYKETFFVITTNENTYHILVTANITVLSDETLIDLTATLTNPHNATIVASAAIPDPLYNQPYIGEVEAIWIHFPEDAVENLVYWILPIAIVATVIAQVALILEDILSHLLFNILLNQATFVWASIPDVLRTLLIADSNDDDTGTHTPFGYPEDYYGLGSFDLYIPYLPFGYHASLVLDGHYYVATSKSWWEIEKQRGCICIIPNPFGGCLLAYCWDYFTLNWICPREPEPPPEPPEISPHASFEWEPIQPIVGEENTFTSTSFDPDGFITAHHWWLGDGNESTEESFTHVYLLAGDYNVTLEVTDNDGLSDNVTHTISVQLEVEARLRVIPDHLDVNILTGYSATAKFITRESLNQTDLQEVTFQASDFKNPDGDVISSGNVTFDKNGIVIAKGSYTNVTVTFQAPTSLPTGWYNGNITASSENGGNATIYVDLMISSPLYELTVTSSPVTGITYTINGSERMTPQTQMLPEGSYTLEMPQTHNGYVWSHWLEDGDTNRIKTITLQGTTWTAVYEPAPKPVGGKATPINIPMNKPETPTLWIWLTILLSLIVTVVYVKKRKRNTEIISKL